MTARVLAQVAYFMSTEFIRVSEIPTAIILNRSVELTTKPFDKLRGLVWVLG